jgi:hypothetical protein
MEVIEKLKMFSFEPHDTCNFSFHLDLKPVNWFFFFKNGILHIHIIYELWPCPRGKTSTPGTIYNFGRGFALDTERLGSETFFNNHDKIYFQYSNLNILNCFRSIKDYARQCHKLKFVEIKCFFIDQHLSYITS